MNVPTQTTVSTREDQQGHSQTPTSLSTEKAMSEKIRRVFELGETIKADTKERGLLREEITLYMERNKQRKLQHDEYDVILVAANTYWNEKTLEKLFKVPDPEVIIEAEAYIPEHQKTIPAQWRSGGLRKLRYYGPREVVSILDEAATGRSHLRVTEKPRRRV